MEIDFIWFLVSECANLNIRNKRRSCFNSLSFMTKSMGDIFVLWK